MIERGNQEWALMKRPAITLESGTPRSREFEDDYYSPEDGLAEANYVFIEGGNIIQRMKNLGAGETLVICELGVGTSLNLALLLQAWSNHAPSTARCHYIGIEKYPLSRAQLKQCNTAFPSLDRETQIIFDRWPSPLAGCHRRNNLVPGFTADFWWEDINDAMSDLATYGQRWVDVWFLDGFTPTRNEAMWSEAVLGHLSSLSNQSAVFTTFTASGTVRRRLEQVGFKVGKRAGFGRKRECLSGYLDISEARDTQALVGHRLTRWDQSEPQAKPRHCIVLGAGIAGCTAARKLAEEGCKVTVVERSSMSSGGSIQPQGIIYTRPSHRHGALTDFALTAYNFSTDQYHQKFIGGHLKSGVDGELTGYLQLADEPLLQRLTSLFGDEDSPFHVVTADEASEIAGIRLDKGAIHYPDSGWLHPAGICRELLRHHSITLIEGAGDVRLVATRPGTWSALTTDGETLAIADAAIITTAWEAKHDKRLEWLPLQPIRGQTTLVESKGELSKLNCAVCHEGYTPPAKLGKHCIGATYGLNDTSTDERTADHHSNMTQLANNIPTVSDALTSQDVSGVASIRCATSDYLPIAGSVPNTPLFEDIFAGLRHDRKRRIDALQPAIPGLWVLTGLGSRGLTSAPLLAELLVSQIMQKPPPMPRYLMRAVSPARFLARRLIKGSG